MQANAGFLEGVKRQILTVNSTDATALTTYTDLTDLIDGFNPNTCGIATVATDRGRVVDLGLPQFQPFLPGDSNINPKPAGPTDEASQGRKSLQQNIILAPTVFHASPSGKTGTIQVFGLYPLNVSLVNASALWALEPIISITFTGTALAAVGTDNYWCSDVAVVASSDNTIYQLLDGSAWAAYPCASGQIAFSTNGARFLYFRFQVGTATSVNGFWRTA